MSDLHRSVSWLTGHRLMRTFPDYGPKTLAQWLYFVAEIPAHRTRRLQLQG